MKTNIKFALIFPAALCCQVEAAIIQFEDLKPLDNYSYIPDGYGSTADVAVSYQTLQADLSSFSSHMQFWNEGYADLKAAAYSDGTGRYAEITLTPKNGMSVSLNSFDMAAYPTGISGRHESDITLLYGGSVLTYGPIDLSGISATHFSPNLTFEGAITIRFGTDWNNGINNIEFIATPVPEPSTYLAGIGALGMLGLFGWRNRK